MNLRDMLLSAEGRRIDYYNDPPESVEEEYLELQTAYEALNEMTLESREIERLSEIAVGLEDLCRVCGFVKNASTVELAMIESATNLALAGTGIKTEEVFPSLESYKGSEISTEAIAKFALNIWKGVVNLQSRVWKSAVRFYGSIFKTVPRLRKSAEDLKVKAESVGEKTLSEGSVELGNLTKALSRDYTGVESLGDLKDNLEFYGSFTGVLLGEYTTMIFDRGSVLSKNLKEQIFEKDDSIIELAKLLILPKNPLKQSINRSSMKLTNLELSKDERFNSDDNYVVPAGLNLYQSRYFITDVMEPRDFDRVLKDSDYYKVEEAEKTRTAIDILDSVSRNKTEIVMAYSTDKRPKQPKGAKVDPIDHNEMEAIADSVLLICDYVELNSSSDKVKELEKVAKDIESVSKKLANTLEKKDLKNNSLATTWRLVANVNVTWLNMVTKPQSQWSSHAFAVARAAIGACNKSLSMYS